MRRTEVDALLQSFEELREAALLFPLLGDIAGEHTGAHNFTALDDGVQHAVVVLRSRSVLETNFNDSRPVPLFQKTRQHGIAFGAHVVAQKLRQLVTDNFGVGDAQDLRHALVYGAHCAIERNCQRDIFQGVNQLFEVALRARDHLGELIQLLIRGHHAGAVLKIFQEMLEFADFAPPAESIDREQGRQDKQAGRNGPQLVRKSLDLLIGKRGDAGGEQDDQPERPSPKLALFPLQMAGRKIRRMWVTFLLGHSNYLKRSGLFGGPRSLPPTST